jgi:hypothetical protein
MSCTIGPNEPSALMMRCASCTSGIAIDPQVESESIEPCPESAFRLTAGISAGTRLTKESTRPIVSSSGAGQWSDGRGCKLARVMSSGLMGFFTTFTAPPDLDPRPAACETA